MSAILENIEFLQYLIWINYIQRFFCINSVILSQNKASLLGLKSKLFATAIIIIFTYKFCCRIPVMYETKIKDMNLGLVIIFLTFQISLYLGALSIWFYSTFMDKQLTLMYILNMEKICKYLKAPNFENSKSWFLKIFILHLTVLSFLLSHYTYDLIHWKKSVLNVTTYFIGFSVTFTLLRLYTEINLIVKYFDVINKILYDKYSRKCHNRLIVNDCTIIKLIKAYSLLGKNVTISIQIMSLPVIMNCIFCEI